jgi:uncharacterized protein YmfQ (DUF2313 family)
MRLNRMHRAITAMRTSMTVTYILLLAIIGCLGLIMSTPDISEANWAGSSGTDACLKCHGTAHSSATINVAIDQVETTSASIDNDGVDSIEIDWMFEGASWTSNKESVGVLLAVPTGWSVVNGTANSPSLTNWSSQWDNVDGGLSWTFLTDPTNDCPAGHECYTVHFTSPWDHDTAGEDMACNLGSSACETGLSDQDGVQSRMGTDAIVKTNPGVQAGAYTVLVYGIGYDGTGRAHKSQTINVTVNDSGTVSAGSPATIVDDNSNGGTKAWGNTGNAAALDDTYAEVLNIDTETSDYLKATNFGFAIPGGATIQGIVVEVDRYSQNPDAVSDAEVKIVKNGVIGSQNKAAGGFWPTSDTNAYQSYGGTNDTWGETWTPADINSTDFGVAISISENGAKGDVFIDHIRIIVYYSAGGNTAPDAPADHAQYRSDASTAINEGWTTNETTVTVKATVSDPDTDNVKLEVEIIDNAGAYTGTPNCSSGFVTSGSVATATCSGLTDGVSYKWRARTNDNIDTSAWQTFGAGDPDVTVKSEMDFGVDASANTNPDDPINLAQYRSNGSTTIASGGYTEELTVVIEADISDPDGGDTVKLQVDIDSDGASDCESTLGANPGTNVQVSCSVTDGVSYNWQVRTGDDKGAFSSWVAFAGSPDFTVDDTAPSYTWNTPAAGTYYKDGDAISIDVSVTDTGVGINDGEDCDPRIDGNTSGFTGSVTYSLASGKCVGTITLNTPSSITDGAHNLTVRMADKLANNSISPDRSINIDNSPPSGLGNSSPADGATDQSTSVNVVASTATDSGSGSVQYYFEVAEDAGFSTGLQQSGWQAGTSYAPTLANSTTYYWHVKTRDALGNETAFTGTWDFTTSTPNTAPDDPTGPGQYRSDGTTVIGQGGYTEESSIIIKASVDDSDAQDVSIEAEIVLNSGSFTGTANCTGGTAVTVPGVAQVTCSGLSDGNDYKWRVRAYDGIDYSNWVTYGGNPDVRVDQTAPAYTWNQPIVPNYFTDGNTITVDVTITEAGAGITNGADCNPKIDGATTEFTGTVTYSTVSGKCTGTLTIDDPSSLTDGPHNVTIEVADDLGNTQQSANRVIDIDNTAPSYTWNTPAAGTYYKDGDTISVDVTITESGEGITNGVNCNAKINGATSEFTGSVTYSAISGKCTGTLTINNPSSLSDSAHSLTVEVADDLGNTQQSAARSINIDNTAPSGLSNSSPADGATDVLLTSNVTANAATDSGSGSVQYYFEVAEDAGFSTGLQQSGWQAGTSYAPTLLSNTSYYWHVKARDGAGNETSYAATWDFTTEVAANSPPDAPADNDQYKADGTTLIAHNGINDSMILKIKATVTDTNSDDVSLEVEIVLNSGSFTGTPNCSSSYVSSGTVATATCGSLVDGASYKWRARTNDGSATSSWQTFGPSDPDVRIILSGQFDITSCSGCHNYPPADGTARNNPVGAVIGAHGVTEHEADIGNCNKCHLIPGATEYDHRDSNIEMSSLIHSQTGSYYDKDQNNTKEAGDSTFAQSNSPTLGNCAATYCHGTDSFQWQTPQLTTYDHL